ncbi:MAG: RNA degradosome polyphosphate kinase, partial [Prevotella sp.]|nr:RNA degradosome polyphosphate kinase [Prevotella sp.]
MTKSDKFKNLYVDRDVSWMYFNHRILQEAKKEYVPLLERLSFLGIYSNNLDEFFRVRMASLNRILESKNTTRKMRQNVKQSIKTITALNEKYSIEYTEVTQQVFDELELHNIRLRNENQLNEEQKSWLRDFYYDKLNGSTNPIWLNEIKNLNSLEDNRIYLVVEMTEEGEKKPKCAVIKVPDKVYGRFVKIPSSEGFDNIMYLDDVVRY